MDMLLFMLGFLGFIVTLVILIINVFRKKQKKKVAIGMLTCLFMMIAGLSMIPSDDIVDEKKVSAISQEKGQEVGDIIEQGKDIEMESDTETKAELDLEEELIALSAGDLYQQYKDNEVAADNKYKKETLEVTGTVKNIGKDVLDNIYITLDVGEYFDSVQCFFKSTESESVANLSKEQEVTVIGRCEGLSISTVVIKNTKIK